jgi:hypothetical protein
MSVCSIICLTLGTIGLLIGALVLGIGYGANQTDNDRYTPATCLVTSQRIDSYNEKGNYTPCYSGYLTYSVVDYGSIEVKQRPEWGCMTLNLVESLLARVPVNSTMDCFILPNEQNNQQEIIFSLHDTKTCFIAGIIFLSFSGSLLISGVVGLIATLS